jgi:hypothetical protein
MTVIVIVAMSVIMSVVVVMSMVMTVLMMVSMAVMVVVTMVMIVFIFFMRMSVHVTIAVFVPIVQIRFAVGMRVFIEDQGLHGHWHRVRGHSDSTQINEVKAPEGDSINDQDLALNTIVLLENMAQIVSNITIGDDVERPFLTQSVGNRREDSAGQF